MGRGDRRRQIEEHRDPAQNSLRDDQAQRGQAEIFHPAARIGAPGPDREDDAEKSHKLGNHAMGVLKFYAADQMRDLVERTERSRPIGDGEAGIIAGHQRAGNDEKKGHHRRKDGEAMVGPVVRHGNGLQKRLLGAYVAPASCRLSRGHLAPARRAGRPPDSRQDAGATFKALYCLKPWSTVLLSLAARVTFWVCSPSFSWTNASV